VSRIQPRVQTVLVAFALFCLAIICGCSSGAQPDHAAQEETQPQRQPANDSQHTSRSLGDSDRADRPERIIERANNAALNEEWKTFYACFTPETNEAAATRLLSLCVGIEAQRQSAVLSNPAISQEAEALTRPIYEVLARHGITQQQLAELAEHPFGEKRDQAVRELARAIPEKEALIADVFVWSQAFGGFTLPNPSDLGNVTKVDVQGDIAIVTMTALGDSETTVTQAKLRRTTDGLRIDLTDMYRE